MTAFTPQNAASELENLVTDVRGMLASKDLDAVPQIKALRKRIDESVVVVRETAVEAALQLHPLVRDRLDQIERVEILTHESALRIIDKTGPLQNPADRDHCLQYMTAIGLIFGALTADHYEAATAADPRIDALRAKMVVREDPRYTREYLEPEKRAIANAVQVFFRDGTTSEKVEVEYPVGHRRRRAEGLPLLVKKFRANASTRFTAGRIEELCGLFADVNQLDQLPAPEFVERFIP